MSIASPSNSFVAFVWRKTYFIIQSSSALHWLPLAFTNTLELALEFNFVSNGIHFREIHIYIKRPSSLIKWFKSKNVENGWHFLESPLLKRSRVSTTLALNRLYFNRFGCGLAHKPLYIIKKCIPDSSNSKDLDNYRFWLY